MNPTTLRPDDGELVRRATRSLRNETGASVAFGGLRGERGIRVTAVAGGRTDRLASIEVRPERGLGGVSWQTGQTVAVADYREASGITHDYDPQILGEGIRTLAVAPIVVGRQVRGLLYAGSREIVRAGETARVLARAAAEVAEELRIRDLVDERVEMRMHGLVAEQPAAGLRDRLWRLYSDTTDPETAAGLGELLGVDATRPAGDELTRRQRDVLDLVSFGLTNAQIAERLGLSELTVKSYLRTIMARFAVRTRAQAVLEARRQGLLR
jgi:LuxR family transcriptional regulator, regulator of acetate metabolism